MRSERPVWREEVVAAVSIENELAPLITFLSAYPGDWWIVGGWAVDLHLGRRTRDHHDVDVGIRVDEQTLFERFFRDQLIELEDPINGSRRPWEHQNLRPGSDILVVGNAPVAAQFLPALFDGDDWVFPRGNRTIRLSWDSLIRATSSGLRYQSPAAVLLHKSRAGRDHDLADFRSLAPALTGQEVEWLRGVLPSSSDNHPWLKILDSIETPPGLGGAEMGKRD